MVKSLGRLVALALVAWLSLGAPASAQTPERPSDVTLAEAQALFQRAVELGDEDRWAEALELFRRSLALVARPSTRFNVGFALFQLGHYREAIATFDAYLAATEGGTDSLRADAVMRRGQAIASLAELTLTVAPTDADVRIDGERDPSTGAVRTIVLDPGRHLVLGTAPGHEDGQLEVSLLAAEHHAATLTLAAIARPTPSPDEAPPMPTPPAEPSVFESPVFWIVTAAAVVAIGAGIGIGLAVADASPPQPYAGSTGVVLRMP